MEKAVDIERRDLRVGYYVRYDLPGEYICEFY